MRRRNFIKAMSLAIATVGAAEEIFSAAVSEYPLFRVQYIGKESIGLIDMTTAGELTFCKQHPAVVELTDRCWKAFFEVKND